MTETPNAAPFEKSNVSINSTNVIIDVLAIVGTYLVIKKVVKKVVRREMKKARKEQ